MPSLKTILPVLGASALVVGSFVLLNASKEEEPMCVLRKPEPPKLPETPPAAPPVGLATEGNTLTLKTRLSHPYIPAQDTPFHAHVQIDVDAVEAVNTPNVPLDVAIVIDCSSSMSGDKITNARIAAQDFVMRLRNGDRATLITYSSGVQTVVAMTSITDDSKRTIQRAIGNLSPSGATNIHDALQTARQAFEQLPKSSQRVRRVLLLSDGRATAGVTNPSNITHVATQTRQGGASISTLGLGDDYQEVLMTNIAEKGGGNYYFISDSSMLATTFEREFATLQTSLARDTSIALKPAPGTRIKHVHGFTYNTDASGVAHIPLGEFWSKRNASIVVDLEISKRPVQTTQAVLTTTLHYNDLTAHQPKTHTTTLTAQATSDTNTIDKHLDAEVIVRADQLKTAQSTQDAMKRFEAGDREGALRILRERNKGLSNMRKDLQDKGKDTDSNAYLFKAMEREEQEASELLKDLGSTDAPSSSKGKKLMKKSRAKAYGKSRLNSF